MLGLREGGITIFRRNCFVSQYRNISQVTLCVTNFGYRKILCLREGEWEGGNITIFCQKFLSHSAKKIRTSAFLCFRNFLSSKNVRDKRGGYHCSRFKLSCVILPKKYMGETFCVSKTFRYRKLSCIAEGVAASGYCRKKFCLKGPY